MAQITKNRKPNPSVTTTEDLRTPGGGNSDRRAWAKLESTSYRASRSRAKTERIESFRPALVVRIRKELREGSYDLASRLPRAMERLIQDLRQEQPA